MSFLRYISRYPDLPSISSRYTSLGWLRPRIVNMNAFFRYSLPAADRNGIRALESFDEEEEWQQKCAHYIVVAAAKGSLQAMIRNLYFPEGIEDKHSANADPASSSLPNFDSVILSPLLPSSNTPPASHSSTLQPSTAPSLETAELSWRLCKDDSSQTFQRFGHSLTHIDVNLRRQPGGDQNTGGNYVMIIAGFGSFDGRHTRKAAIDVIGYESGSSLASSSSSSSSARLRRCQMAVVSGLEMLGDRIFHTCTAIDAHRLLVFGGRASPMKPFAHPVVVEWRVQEEKRTDVGGGGDWGEEGRSEDLPPFRVSVKSFQTVDESTPHPRWRHSATYLPPSNLEVSSSGSVLVFGGKIAHDVVANEAYLLDLAHAKWTRFLLSDDPTQARLQDASAESLADFPHRCSHTATAWKHSSLSSTSGSNSVLIFGGLDAEFNASPAVFRLDVEAQTLIPFGPLVGQLAPRFGHTANLVHRKASSESGDASTTAETTTHPLLLIVGGVNASPFGVPGVALYDLVTRVATEFHVPAKVDNEVLMLRNHQCFFGGRRKRSDGVEDDPEEAVEMVIVGGGGNCFSFGTHFNADFFSFSLPLANSTPKI